MWRDATKAETKLIQKTVGSGIRLLGWFCTYWKFCGLLAFIYYVYIEILIIAGLKEGWVGFPILVFIIIYFAFYKAPTALMREAKKNNMFDHYYIYETKIIDRYEDLSSIDHDKPGNRANRDFVVVNIPVSDHEHEDRRVNVRHYYHGKIGDPVKVVTNDDKNPEHIFIL